MMQRIGFIPLELPKDLEVLVKLLVWVPQQPNEGDQRCRKAVHLTSVKCLLVLHPLKVPASPQWLDM